MAGLDYSTGLADRSAAKQMHRYEVVHAVTSWKAAESDHAATNFWGADRVRNMRGYWLGVLRLQRQRDWGWSVKT
jgi:hypothetical protein